MQAKPHVRRRHPLGRGAKPEERPGGQGTYRQLAASVRLQATLKGCLHDGLLHLQSELRVDSRLERVRKRMASGWHHIPQAPP